MERLQTLITSSLMALFLSAKLSFFFIPVFGPVSRKKNSRRLDTRNRYEMYPWDEEVLEEHRTKTNKKHKPNQNNLTAQKSIHRLQKACSKIPTVVGQTCVVATERVVDTFSPHDVGTISRAVQHAVEYRCRGVTRHEREVELPRSPVCA